MVLLNYMLALVVTFLGLFVGLVLVFTATEELKAGRKFFILLTRIIFSLAFVLLLLSYSIPWWLIVIMVIAYFAVDYHYRIDERYIYALLAVIFFLSYRNQNLFILESMLIFLYGFPAGSLFCEKLVKKKLLAIGKLFLNHLHYLIIAALPFLVVYL